MERIMRFKYWNLGCVLVFAIACSATGKDPSPKSEPLLSADDLFAPDHLVDVNIEMKAETLFWRTAG